MDYFDYEYRVRYGDTDKMGISYYANYLAWMEAARTEYFRALGLPYTECEKQGYFLPVVEAGLKYASPSTYDDLLIIRTSVSHIGHTSMKFEYQIFLKADGRKVVTGFTTHAFVNAEIKPVRAPDSVRKLVTVFKLLEKQ